MGTNYYRIPTYKDIKERHAFLMEKMQGLDLANYDLVFNKFSEYKNDYERILPWDEFLDGIKVHVGKRSGGWKFLWNFNNNKYYTNKKELLAFIRSGRVVSEYGELMEAEDFIKMALNWEQPNGMDVQTYHNMKNDISWDKYIDGLRVSPTSDFS